MKGAQPLNNIEVRQAIKAARLMQWEIAARIGISEFTFSRWLRTEMSEERKESVLAAISELKAVENRA